MVFVSKNNIFVTFRHYLELIRFSHTLFAFPFAVLSSLMAIYSNQCMDKTFPFRGTAVLGIVLCMVFARSAAMAFNRYADRKIDKENPRTSGRHIPAETISSRNALVFTLVCSIGFVASTALFLPDNAIPLAMSIPVLLFLFGYSYAKRWTILVHWWLGTALMLAPIAAWVAIRPVFSWAPVFLGLAVLFWSAGFDIIYALMDEEFDRRKKIFSIPARFGTRRALRIAAFSHMIMLAFLVMVPCFFAPFRGIYYAGLLMIALVLLVEHLIVKPDDPGRINLVFFWLNIFVSLVLLLSGGLDIFLCWR